MLATRFYYIMLFLPFVPFLPSASTEPWCLAYPTVR